MTETEDVRMVLVPVKFLAVEAFMPDRTVGGVSTTMEPDTPEHVLTALEGMLLDRARHDFPGAVEYRSSRWIDSQTLVPEDLRGDL